MNEESLGPTVIPGEQPPKTDGIPQVKATTGLTDGQPSKTVLAAKDHGLISRVREALARIAGR